MFLKPLYYRFFYFGDRITGTISVTIDGEKYDLKGSDLFATHDNEKDIKIGFRNQEDTAAISIHGGEYGPYRLMIQIDGIDSPLEAVIYQYNWYNVSKFDLDISIDRAADCTVDYVDVLLFLRMTEAAPNSDFQIFPTEKDAFSMSGKALQEALEEELENY